MKGIVLCNREIIAIGKNKYSTKIYPNEGQFPFQGEVIIIWAFQILLENHWATFNQTWHKASLDTGGSFFSFLFFLQMNNSFLRKGIHPLCVSSFNQRACVIIAVVLMLQLVYSWEMFLRWVMWSMGLLNLCLSITHLYIRTYNNSQMKNDRLRTVIYWKKDILISEINKDLHPSL